MAKKKNQSLTERIAALINRVGEKPEPTFGDIKSELVECLGLAETLEEGAVIRDAEAKISALETVLEESNTELGKLKIETEALKSELQTFRAERQKQEEEKKREEMPDIQFEILQRLPTEHAGDGATLRGICGRNGIPPDEAEVHLDRLEKAGFTKRRSVYAHAAGYITTWYRTIPGNELVLANRLAGEEEAEQDDEEHPELTQMEQLVLLAVADGNRVPAKIVKFIEKAIPTVGRPITSEGTVLLLLVTLRGKKVVTDEPMSGAPFGWKTTRIGRNYLADLENFS
jgi:hypothetical protein